MEEFPTQHHHHHQEGGISPLPINSYGHMTTHDHPHHPAAAAAAVPSLSPPIHSNNGQGPGPGLGIGPQTHLEEGQGGVPYNSTTTTNNTNNKRLIVGTTTSTTIRYRECLKNHAAALGGNARDGCGEFMPSGEEGTMEALHCSACHCHRNFHRKELQGEEEEEETTTTTHHPHFSSSGGLRKVILGHHHYHHHKGGFGPVGPTGPIEYSLGYPTPTGAAAAATTAQGLMKKRFRTKFTPEQKEKMLRLAERIGWRLQKQEEGVVQQFCQEIGVKRRVLKVWMHNNKHTLANKNNPNNTTTST